MRQADLRELLAGVRRIAVVGFSANPARPSYDVARFLVARGYACIGVNPGIAGRQVRDIPVVARLANIDGPVDMVDIFRASHAVAGVVDEALALPTLPRIIWMQLGVSDEAAKARAEAAGLVVVMNNCPKIVLTARSTRTNPDGAPA